MIARRWLVAGVLVLAACGGGRSRVVVAAGTTVVDSGLIELVAERYEAEHPDVTLSVVGEATAKVLELGRRGGADVLITHAPDQEALFASEGLARFQAPFMDSRFVLVGPEALVDRLSGLTVVEAFDRIAVSEWGFVSRGDGSGTHTAELAIWDAVGLVPDDAAWYHRTGQGMGLTLQVADRREAFVLTEVGAVRAISAVGLAEARLAATDHLANPYTVTVATGAPSAATDFARWLTDDPGAEAVATADRLLFEGVLYVPRR